MARTRHALLSSVDAVMETATESGDDQTHTHGPGNFLRTLYNDQHFTARAWTGPLHDHRLPCMRYVVHFRHAGGKAANGKHHTARGDAHNGRARVPNNYSCPSLQMGYTSMARSVAILFKFGGFVAYLLRFLLNCLLWP